MNVKDILKLIEYFRKNELTELEIEMENVKIRIKRDQNYKVSIPTPVEVHEQTTKENVETKEQVEEIKEEIKKEEKPDKNIHVIKSPMVGTFYRAPSPGAEPFVKEGDRVRKGDTLCIIEAMKVMNEIESDVDGVVEKILVANGEPVEYGQELFWIRVS